MRIIALAAIMLIAGCTSSAPWQSNSQQSAAPVPGTFVTFGFTRIDDSLELAIVRDRDTGCDWLWVSGIQAGGLQQRTDAKGPVCDIEAHSGFETLPRSFIGGRGHVTFVIIRDRDTGCEWIWGNAYKAGVLQRRMGPSGQICTQIGKDKP